MKLILILLLTASSVFANDFWVIDSQERTFATTKEEILKVVTLHPRIMNFPNIKLSDFVSIDLTDTTYKYISSHTCQENDSRLKVRHVIWELCFKDGSCAKPMSFPGLVPHDPCNEPYPQ